MIKHFNDLTVSVQVCEAIHGIVYSLVRKGACYSVRIEPFFFSEVILICRWKTLSDTQNWTFKSLVSSSRCDWEPDRLLGLECEVLTPPSPLSCRPEASCAPPSPVRLPLPAPSLEVSFSSVSQPLPQRPRDLPVPRPLVSSLLDLKTSSQRTAHTLMFYFLSLDRKEG